MSVVVAVVTFALNSFLQKISKFCQDLDWSMWNVIYRRIHHDIVVNMHVVNESCVLLPIRKDKKGGHPTVRATCEFCSSYLQDQRAISWPKFT